MLLQYHQETAPAFHGQQDVWALPNELAQGTSPVAYRPEYGIWALPGERDPAFNLATVFVPAGRQNLTGVLVGRADDTGVPQLTLLDVRVEDQVPGPRQIEALVEQDPVISQQFSLWRTGGSEVWTGHLHLVPVGRRLLYMEPVFLAAAADAIPELRRFVVSDGRRVAMREDLAESHRHAGRRGCDGRRRRGPGQAPAEGLPPAHGHGQPWTFWTGPKRGSSRGDWQGFGAALERAAHPPPASSPDPPATPDVDPLPGPW